MCGIVGAVAKRSITQVLVDGLKRLEYRGYDSAGIAVLNQDLQLQRLRTKGKVCELAKALQENPLQAYTGIAHTRWATHGAPSEQNAHPLLSHDEFALVHNGIIENHAALRTMLSDQGYQFHSQTDTETAVHLIHYYYQQHQSLLLAISHAIKDIKGSYALGVFSIHEPDHAIGVCQGAPLVVGIGQDENYIASDSLALLAYTKDIIYLENNDIVELTADEIKIYDKHLKPVTRQIHAIDMSTEAIERGPYKHYMLKEIMEQPTALRACLKDRIDLTGLKPCFEPALMTTLPSVAHIQLVACGTSYHAAMVAKYWLEELTQIPCSVEVASEFRYRKIATSQNSLYITLSQSGETADSLAALQMAKHMPYLHRLVITNVAQSTMTREADSSFFTHAGIEIGVASTKAFITQLMALLTLALTIRTAKNHAIDQDLIRACAILPNVLHEILQQNNNIAAWAKHFSHKTDALFLGRGLLYPIALEGALKLKEISYIHAEGYPAGELKHGPLALIDANMPVIATVADDEYIDKIITNLQEVKARDGELFIFADEKITKAVTIPGANMISLPHVPALLAPIAHCVPLQLLAYHVAVLKGTDVDQPRNLAKSVTVE